LLGGCKLSPDVFAVVLRELASEDMVRFGMDASGTQVIGPGAPSPRSGRSLLPFEHAVLGRLSARVRGRAGIPLWVLLGDNGDGYDRWQRMQAAQLGREAQRAGLAVRSAGKGVWQTALALAVLAACAAIVVYQVAPKAGLDATAAAIVVGFLAVVVPLSMRRWRLTPTGAATVAEWRRSSGSLQQRSGF
jgi:hypothetical protein